MCIRDSKYAPAWKTLEYMTLGGIIHLFKALKDQMIRRAISEHFKVRQLPVFERYLKAILTIRNYCAHGNVLYDIALPTSIRRGPAGQMESANYHKPVSYTHLDVYKRQLRDDLTKKSLNQKLYDNSFLAH